MIGEPIVFFSTHRIVSMRSGPEGGGSEGGIEGGETEGGSEGGGGGGGDGGSRRIKSSSPQNTVTPLRLTSV
jgi:hypothetical protein